MSTKSCTLQTQVFFYNLATWLVFRYIHVEFCYLLSDACSGECNANNNPITTIFLLIVITYDSSKCKSKTTECSWTKPQFLFCSIWAHSFCFSSCVFTWNTVMSHFSVWGCRNTNVTLKWSWLHPAAEMNNQPLAAHIMTKQKLFFN